MPAGKKSIDSATLVGGLANGKTRSQTAKDLGVSESTLKRRMKDQGTTFTEKRSKLNPLGGSRKSGK